MLVTGGTMSNFAAVNGSARLFRMDITPTPYVPPLITIYMRGSDSCGGICTADGKIFKQQVVRYVSGADETRLRGFWLTRAGTGIGMEPEFHSERTEYSAEVSGGTGELTLHAAPYTPGVSIAVSGPAGTFTVTDRWDNGKTVVLDLPHGASTWAVAVTSPDGTRTRYYRMSVYRGVSRPPPGPFDGCYGEFLYRDAPAWTCPRPGVRGPRRPPRASADRHRGKKRRRA